MSASQKSDLRPSLGMILVKVKNQVDPACRVIFARKQTDITFQNRESQENVILSVIVVLSGSQISWKLFTDSYWRNWKGKYFLLTVFVHLPKWQQCLCHDHYLLKTPSNSYVYQKKKNQFSADAMAMSRIWSTKSWLTFPSQSRGTLQIINQKPLLKLREVGKIHPCVICCISQSLLVVKHNNSANIKTSRCCRCCSQLLGL